MSLVSIPRRPALLERFFPRLRVLLAFAMRDERRPEVVRASQRGRGWSHTREPFPLWGVASQVSEGGAVWRSVPSKASRLASSPRP